jgi:hypothetical protein
MDKIKDGVIYHSQIDSAVNMAGEYGQKIFCLSSVLIILIWEEDNFLGSISNISTMSKRIGGEFYP